MDLGHKNAVFFKKTLNSTLSTSKLSLTLPLGSEAAVQMRVTKECFVGTILIFKTFKKMDLIKIAEEAFATGKEFPKFKAGDTITVAYKIIEGTKERIQLYRGVVIKISGEGQKKRFTVRKMSGTVGVERIFPIESPNIDSITVNKVGKVRRSKLYYLRNLTGKKARIKEKLVRKSEEA